MLRATAACIETPAAVASLLFDPPPTDKSLENTKFSQHFADQYLLSSGSFSFSLLYFSFLFFLFFSSLHIVGSLESQFISISCKLKYACRLSSWPKTTKLEMNKTTIYRVRHVNRARNHEKVKLNSLDSSGTINGS